MSASKTPLPNPPQQPKWVHHDRRSLIVPIVGLVSFVNHSRCVVLAYTGSRRFFTLRDRPCPPRPAHSISSRIAATIRCSASGSSSLRSAPSAPGRAKPTKALTLQASPTTPPATSAPANARSGGEHNPDYKSVFAFDNDFPALLPDEPPASPANDSPLLVAEPERGRCRVLCFHPNHSLTLARMSVPDIAAVVDAWAFETATIGDLPYINHVQIFENRGAMMGASNPHPHCQIWATEHIPDEPLRELAAQQAYREEHHSCLLCDYLAAELAHPDARIIAENDHFVALVPYWAIWPFETMVLPRRHLGDFPSLTPAERTGLAAILKAVTTRYDNLFQIQLPLLARLPPAPHPRPGARRHALPRPLLSPAAALRGNPQIHGRLRDVRLAPARPHPRNRRRPPPRPPRHPLPRLE